ncbi:hypothetical protein DIPPA_12774 [Diplonema papillatum]|nr:hypothetical protein DIPPA_12774 [Diplonema papillatum]
MRRTYRAPPRLSPLEKAAIAVIVLCVGSLYLRYLSVVSGASADGAPRTAGPEGAREKAWLMPECYYLQAHTCSRMEWKVMPPDDAAGGGGTRSVEVAEAWTTRWRIMQPGLWGEDTLSFILCDDPVRGGVRHFLSHTGCDIEVGPEVDDIFYRQSASFVRHQGRYYNGFFTLEAADFEGHYITSRGGVLALEPEDTRAEFRRDASWVMESDGRQRSSSLRTGVFLLKQPLPPGTEVPVVIDDERTCAKEHNGCCQITEDGFVMPKTKDLGPADPATTDVTAIIISSKNTIGKRRSLLDTWLLKPLQQPRKFNSVWTQAVISLDCFTDDIETSVPNTDWVVGPLGAGPVGVPIIVIRVTMITHWAFDS